MSKLEELKAARDAARDALIAALDVLSAAGDAYEAELKKTQEEKQND
jgi:hypothetical protein